MESNAFLEELGDTLAFSREGADDRLILLLSRVGCKVDVEWATTACSEWEDVTFLEDFEERTAMDGLGEIHMEVLLFVSDKCAHVTGVTATKKYCDDRPPTEHSKTYHTDNTTRRQETLKADILSQLTQSPNKLAKHWLYFALLPFVFWLGRS